MMEGKEVEGIGIPPKWSRRRKNLLRQSVNGQ